MLISNLGLTVASFIDKNCKYYGILSSEYRIYKSEVYAIAIFRVQRNLTYILTGKIFQLFYHLYKSAGNVAKDIC